jgi:asparagine synthase (glutamine-hydrolysing)
MVSGLAHRGPDDEGIYRDAAAAVALGQRRLSVIDLSAAGHQPMSLCGRYWIVYNGEVYNYRALRSRLAALGRQFESGTDTEVVLAAYAEWGPRCVKLLRGMFAFAIWDAQKRELFLARDRFGIKPLYYAHEGGGLLFASELGSLLASGRVRRLADGRALWSYLSHGAVAQPHTILRDVAALLPGHSMRVRRGGIDIERYWDIEEATRESRPERAAMTYADATACLRTELDTATRLHLIADVPVGAFLSGGIDSTLVVGLMSQLASEPIRTFAVGFEGLHSALNELKWARWAATRFDTEHTEVIVSQADAPDIFERLIPAIDQPSIDGTNTFIVSEATRRHVTVALSGLGGDELFAGYPHFDSLRRAEARLPDGSTWAQPLVARLSRPLPRRWALPLETLVANRAQRLHSLRLLLREQEKQQAVGPAFRAFGTESDTSRAAGQLRPLLDAVTQTSYAELTGYMRDTLLRDADALSMAHSLEVRPILLDHVLAEYAFSLPAQFKIRGSSPKRVLIDSARDLLPEEIINRAKMGFELPLTSWLKTSLRERARGLFDAKTARALFSPQFLLATARELDGGVSRTNRIWAYAVLLAWFEHHAVELEE